jgi:hypothetical protein
LTFPDREDSRIGITILEIDKCPVWHLKYNSIKSKLTISREVDKDEVFEAYRRKIEQT